MLPTEEQSGINSCCHYDMSEIKTKNNGDVTFPQHYLEDYYVDYFEDNDIEYNIKDGICTARGVDWETLYRVKCEAYSACVWYEPLAHLTYRSTLIPIDNGVDKALEKINYPSFIKLDTVSAKDTGHDCVFSGIVDAQKTFKGSGRIQETLKKELLTREHHYLFVREVDPYIKQSIEIRCFVYQLKLTAVSSETELPNTTREKIMKFMDSVIDALPYQNAVVDLIINNKSNSIMVIELNNFGADSPAGAGNFNWKDDFLELHNDRQVTWRHAPEFGF